MNANPAIPNTDVEKEWTYGNIVAVNVLAKLYLSKIKAAVGVNDRQLLLNL